MGTSNNIQIRNRQFLSIDNKQSQGRSLSRQNADDLVYQEMVDICKKIEQKRKAGWLLVDSDNEIMNGKIVFSSPFHKKCIAFKTSANGWSSLVVYGETITYGKDTLLLEYKEALKHLNSFKMIDPKYIKNLTDL